MNSLHLARSDGEERTRDVKQPAAWTRTANIRVELTALRDPRLIGAHAAIAAPARPSGRASATTAASSHRAEHHTIPPPNSPSLARGTVTSTALLRGPVEPRQFIGLTFGQTCHDAGIAVSMGSRGDAYDKELVSQCTSCCRCG